MIEQRRGQDPAPGQADRSVGFVSWLWNVNRVGHLLVLVVLAAVGAGVLGVVGDRAPVTYHSEVRLAVGPESLLSQSVAGFTEASKQLASNYARYVVDTGAGARELARRLDVPAAEIAGVQASPIASSNIIRIDVSSTNPTTGNRAASLLSRQLLRQVNAAPPELPRLRSEVRSTARTVAKYEAQLEDLSRRAKAARARSSASATRRISGEQVTVKSAFSLAQADNNSAVSMYTSSLQQGTSTASLRVVRPATTVSDSQASTVQWRAIQGAAGGAVLGLLLLALVYGGRRRARARTSR